MAKERVCPWTRAHTNVLTALGKPDRQPVLIQFLMLFRTRKEYRVYRMLLQMIPDLEEQLHDPQCDLEAIANEVSMTFTVFYFSNLTNF